MNTSGAASPQGREGKQNDAASHPGDRNGHHAAVGTCWLAHLNQYGLLVNFRSRGSTVAFPWSTDLLNYAAL